MEMKIGMMGKLQESIYAEKANPYGFRYNINHRNFVFPIYKEYYKAIGERISFPLPDKERIRFECVMDNILKRHGAERKEYFKTVMQNIKPLDLKRARINKRTDCLTEVRLRAIGLI